MDANSKKTARPKKRVGTVVAVILAVLAALTGVALLLYPTVADYLNSRAAKNTITGYERAVEKLDDSTKERMLGDAREWNRELLQLSTRIGALDGEQAARYETLLDPTGTGVMGYLEVEKADIYLPIYHGTEENVLYSGVGHLAGSSLPVGGEGVHTILSGHSGLPSARLFTNIDELTVGDTFVLRILGETLTYRVISRVTLLPEEAEKQSIDPEKDLCTLITCTPYGVNTHRLLVTGERIETPADSTSDGAGNVQTAPDLPADAGEDGTPWTVLLLSAGGVLAAAVVICLLVRRRSRKKRRNAEKADEAKNEKA